MTLLLILPALSFFPKVTIAVSSAPIGESSTSWLLLAWIAGALFFLVRKLSDFSALLRWKREASPCELGDLFEKSQRELGFQKPTQVRVHPEFSSPVVTGLISPTIFLPTTCHQWSESTLKMALLHELSHLQRRDLWMALLPDLACIVHWFNPAVWWMRSDLFFIGCQTFTDPGKYLFGFADLTCSITNNNRLFVLGDLVATVGALH